MVRVPPTSNDYLYNGQQMNRSEMDFETSHSPIIISDDDDDDNNNNNSNDNDNSNSNRNNNRNKRNKHVIVIISDDEEDDIYSIPAKQYYTSIKPDNVMADQLDDSADEEDDSIATIDPPVELGTTYLKGEKGIGTRQPPHSTRSLKRPREHLVIEEGSKNETTRDDSSSSNNMMKEYPWWQLNGGQPSSLQDQVMDFVQYLQPRKHEILLRHYLVHKIRYILQAKFMGVQVDVFGSFGSNTFLPNSDIDLVVSSLPRQDSLYSVSNVLKDSGCSIDRPRIIINATVPVLKFVDALTSLHVDIVLASKNGVTCTQYISDVLDRYPCARELTLIVKYMVYRNFLNNVYMGGIGGLSVTCLVVRFLQEQVELVPGTVNLDQDLGRLLLGFFHRYGFDFELGKESVSIVGNGYSNKKTKRYYQARYGQPVFSIIHPLDSFNDIGAKSFRSDDVTRLFRTTYTTLVSALTLNPRTGLENVQPDLGASANSLCHSSCLLMDIGSVPETLISKRALMDTVYTERKWIGETAAGTFDWNMQV